MTRLIFQYCILLFALGTATAASALDLGTTSPQGIKVIEGEDPSPNDFVIMSPPNAHGISFNIVPRFTVDRPLKIANTQDSYGSNVTQAAKLIVIQSNDINILNTIEVLGETADILLISTATAATVRCTNCGFKNFGRVTLATAKPLTTLSTQTSLIGELSTASSGTVAINGLSAPGAASIELLANTMALTGNINTQMKGDFHSAGGYEIKDTGRLVIGSGGVNIYARSMTLNYETLGITKIVDTGATSYIGATITSAAIRVTTASPLTIAGRLSTKSDILASTSYRNLLSAANETIDIKTLSRHPSRGSILLNNELLSDEKITVKASGNLSINKKVESKTIELTVGESFLNKNVVDAQTVEIVARKIENNGTITGKGVYAVSLLDFQNRFGGKILADTIELSSTHGVVRNGSQYPFKPASETSLVLTPEAYNTTNLSTVDAIDFVGATKVADLSARIIGRTITISAQTNIENINPYFTYTKDPIVWRENGIPFDPTATDRVVLIAENILNLKAGIHVLNSSAIMGVNNPGPASSHIFRVVAPSMTNARYKTNVLVDVVNESEEIIHEGYGQTSTTTNTSSNLLANLYVYSPPGTIYSFPTFAINFGTTGGSTAGFLNNTAFFEAFNDAHFVGNGRVTSLGLNLEKENHRFVSTTIYNFSRCYQYGSYSAYHAPICNSTSSSGSSSSGTTTSEEMAHTLFSVAGNAYGEQAKLTITNHEALDNIKNNIISDYIAEQYQHNISEAVTLPSYYTYWQHHIREAKLSADGQNIIFENTTYGEAMPDTEYYGEETDFNSGYYEQTGPSVWNLLVEKLASIKAAFIAQLDAFINWWNS